LLHTSALFFQILFYFTLLVFSPASWTNVVVVVFHFLLIFEFFIFSPLLILFGLRWWKKIWVRAFICDHRRPSSTSCI
jgi:hypothetical protein